MTHWLPLVLALLPLSSILAQPQTLKETMINRWLKMLLTLALIHAIENSSLNIELIKITLQTTNPEKPIKVTSS